ncbi:hypothetical protein GA0070624_5455 [Micromonospora rhizosphaerae]|uniref:Uncharacterized protein n=1 Tax=Micromonospora rhizosphaerae TaxID=568872 RepID=A0A1C6T314_9ACTN|nr:hypothetical protein [Micromonospora rhizosphaerae]SCL36097.1 hypothetical protein GA0070624_5455 [Micromonospora rhizosphaerae]
MTDVAAAWRGFRGFLQFEVEGLGTEPDTDINGLFTGRSTTPLP